MKFGIVRFPGSNCDDDALDVCARVLAPEGTKGEILWHKDHDLRGVDVVILPGGFSYGDYLRAGAMAAWSPIMREVKAFAERGGWVFAICNGFQIACEAGLLEGALAKNASLHSEGRYVHPDVDRLEKEGLVVFRYVTPDGRLTAEANPNGSIANIAGVTNARGNVVGLMPHPERAVEALLGEGGEDGRRLFESAVAAAA